MFLTIVVCTMFLQRIIRNYIHNQEMKFHTLSEYCNHDIITKSFLFFTILFSYFYVLYNDFSYPILIFSTIYLGILCRTNCKLWKYIYHYVGGTVLIMYNFYKVWHMSKIIYLYVINIGIFGALVKSPYKMIAFVSEGVFISICSYFLMNS